MVNISSGYKPYNIWCVVPSGDVKLHGLYMDDIWIFYGYDLDMVDIPSGDDSIAILTMAMEIVSFPGKKCDLNLATWQWTIP